MTIFRHKQTGNWVAQITEGGKKRQVGTFPTKREARVAERRALDAAPSSTMTVTAWRAAWLTNPEWRESTRQHNEERTRAFVAAHGSRRLRDVNRTLARQWAAEQPSTVGALTAMFGAAMYEDDEHGNPLLGADPFSRLVKRRAARRDLRPDWLGEQDIVSLEVAARREAFREAVEALRGLLAVDDPSAWGAMNGDEAVERAADFIERSFLSPDNPEGNA